MGLELEQQIGIEKFQSTLCDQTFIGDEQRAPENIIMMSYANYLSLVLKSRKQIIPYDKEDQNVVTGVCFSLLLLAYPLFIAYFLL